MSTSLNLGNVTGKVIDDIKEESGEIVIYYKDGTQSSLGNVGDTATPEDITVDGDVVNVVYSDGTVMEAGMLTELKIHRIVDATIDDGYIVGIYDNGDRVNLNQVTMEDPIKNTYFDEDSNIVYGELDNGVIVELANLEQYTTHNLSKSITDISVDSDDNIIITTEDSSYNAGKLNISQEIPPYDAQEPIDVVDVYISDTNGVMYIELSNGDTLEAGKAQSTIINGEPLSVTNAKIDENGELILDILSANGIEEKNVGKVTCDIPDLENLKGGTKFTGVDLTSSNRLIFRRDGDSDLLTDGYFNVKSIEDAYVDDDIFKIKFDNNEIIDVFNVNEINTSIDKIVSGSVNDNGHLVLKFSSSEEIDAGKVTIPYSTTVDVIDDKIVFGLSDGTTHIAGDIPLFDANENTTYIESLSKDSNGNIISTLNTGDKIDLGGIKQYITSLRFDEDNYLTVHHNDGSSITSDSPINIPEINSFNSVSMDEDKLVLKYTENSLDTLKTFNIDDIRGKRIDRTEVATVDDKYILRIIYTDGNIDEHELPRGKDGKGIENIYISDGDLVIQNTIDDYRPIKIDDFRGDGIVSITTNSDGALVLKNNSLEEFILEPIQGKDGVGITNITKSGKDLVLLMSDNTTKIVENVYTEDGDVLDSYNISGNNLVLNYTKFGTINIPLVKGKINNLSVESVNFDEIEDTLDITYYNGDVDSISIPIPDDPTNVENITVVDDNLVITTNYDSYTINNFKGKDGNSIENITKNNNTLTFSFTDGKTEDFILPITEDGNSISDITYDNTTNKLTIIADDGNTTIDNFRGIDGKNISNITHENDQLKITYDNTDVDLFDFPLPIDGDGISTIEYQNNDVIIKTTSNNTITIPSVKGTDGLDGEEITDVSLSGTDITFTTNSSTYTIPNSVYYPESVNVDGDGFLVLNMNDGTVITSDNRIKGIDGTGKGIKNITLTDGVLTVVVTDPINGDETTYDGNISMVPIENVYKEDGVLKFRYSNGDIKTIGNVDGKDGDMISNVSILDDTLTVEIDSNGVIRNETFNGVKGKDGVHVTDIKIDPNSGDVTSVFSDSTEKNSGNIKDGLFVAPWKSTESYGKDRVVIHNSRLFLSLYDNNTNEPPHTNWKEVVYDNDLNIPDITPVALYPDESSYVELPFDLIGNSYIFPYTKNERLHREFVIELNDGSYSKILHETVNSDYLNITTLEVPNNTSIRWTYRDIAVDGYISPWSDYIPFTINITTATNTQLLFENNTMVSTVTDSFGVKLDIPFNDLSNAIFNIKNNDIEKNISLKSDLSFLHMEPDYFKQWLYDGRYMTSLNPAKQYFSPPSNPWKTLNTDGNFYYHSPSNIIESIRLPYVPPNYDNIAYFDISQTYSNGSVLPIDNSLIGTVVAYEENKDDIILYSVVINQLDSANDSQAMVIRHSSNYVVDDFEILSTPIPLPSGFMNNWEVTVKIQTILVEKTINVLFSSNVDNYANTTTVNVDIDSISQNRALPTYGFVAKKAYIIIPRDIVFEYQSNKVDYDHDTKNYTIDSNEFTTGETYELKALPITKEIQYNWSNIITATIDSEEYALNQPYLVSDTTLPYDRIGIETSKLSLSNFGVYNYTTLTHKSTHYVLYDNSMNIIEDKITQYPSTYIDLSGALKDDGKYFVKFRLHGSNNTATDFSALYELNLTRSIDIPSIETTETATSYSNNGKINIIPPTVNNERITSYEYKIITADENLTYLNEYLSPDYITFTIPIVHDMLGKSVSVKVRAIGTTITSEWSNNIFTFENTNYSSSVTILDAKPEDNTEIYFQTFFKDGRRVYDLFPLTPFKLHHNGVSYDNSYNYDDHGIVPIEGSNDFLVVMGDRSYYTGSENVNGYLSIRRYDVRGNIKWESYLSNVDPMYKVYYLCYKNNEELVFRIIQTSPPLDRSPPDSDAILFLDFNSGNIIRYHDSYQVSYDPNKGEYYGLYRSDIFEVHNYMTGKVCDINFVEDISLNPNYIDRPINFIIKDNKIYLIIISGSQSEMYVLIYDLMGNNLSVNLYPESDGSYSILSPTNSYVDQSNNIVFEYIYTYYSGTSVGYGNNKVITIDNSGNILSNDRIMKHRIATLESYALAYTDRNGNRYSSPVWRNRIHDKNNITEIRHVGTNHKYFTIKLLSYASDITPEPTYGIGVNVDETFRIDRDTSKSIFSTYTWLTVARDSGSHLKVNVVRGNTNG